MLTKYSDTRQYSLLSGSDPVATISEPGPTPDNGLQTEQTAMTEYQQKAVSNLKTLGWVQAGSQALRGPGRQASTVTHKLTNQLGHRAYVYPEWTQYIT